MVTAVTLALCVSAFAVGVSLRRLGLWPAWREVALLGTIGAILVAGALFAGSFL